MHPDGLGMTKGQDKSTADLKKRIQAAYHKKCNGVDNVEEEFSEILEWYLTTIASQTAQKRLEGLSEKQLVKIAGPFNNRIVDGVSARAVAFGSDPYYLGMKEDNPLQMRDQCVDYGTMIHAQLMRKKQGALLDPRKQKIINKYLEDKTNKVTLRTPVKDIWIHDLQTLCPNSNITQMKWGSAFADMCYREKIKLVNYPRGLKAIGAPGGLQAVSGIEKNYLKTIVGDRVQFWQQEARETRREAVENEDKGMAPLYDDDSDKGSTSKYEKALSVADRANSGIVTEQPRGNEEPLVLTKVLYSKKYVEYARAEAPRQLVERIQTRKTVTRNRMHLMESRKTKVGKSIAVCRERVQEGESSDEEDSDSELDAPRESRKMQGGQEHCSSIRERVQEERAPVEPTKKEEDCGDLDRDAEHRFRLSPCRAREEEEDCGTSSRRGARFRLSPCRALRKKKKTLAPRRDAEHDSDSVPAEPARRRRRRLWHLVETRSTIPTQPLQSPRRRRRLWDLVETWRSTPIQCLLRLPKKIAGKGRDEVGLVRKAHVETQETDENEEQPRKRARLNREHGKKHGKEKNIADQSEVVGGQGRKRKRDEDAPRVIAQLSRPIVKLPKRKSGD
ncbi:hypothetical protein BT96DRAFT_943377 [Gymnopus androsaceus JB14]|uniref:Uncharacterized protein n=1 Tax=Gymnopus androsaceus JB14 TaxID=1447944 RepID=A0A6A4H7F5_9AGAR|nr:hypothetical protein BT96DRAFT_943377 [Gymnopus androsaceus JB14]